MKKYKLRGLVSIAGWIILVFGLMVITDGVYDMFWGEPESNMFSFYKWQFVSLQQWANYARFELIYGLCCVLITAYLWGLSKKVPEYGVTKEGSL
ncbi:MAG: hypothetical protein WC955_01335 [Elusimicrobiota bacterium]